MDEVQLREQLARSLGWRDAHATFEDAVDGVPPGDRGRRAAGFPHTLWHLVEHVRIAQADLLEFCRNPSYEEMTWPEAYWPASDGPADEAEWKGSLDQVRADRESLAALTCDASTDLTGSIPHGTGQTYLREVLLALDHTAYHVGQMVMLRRLLGNWD
jgi:hypothetical protein